MRQARIKPKTEGTYYHVMNRIAGDPGVFPFTETDREMFVRLLKKLARYYVLEPLAYQVMGNHFHLILYAPAEAPSPEETARRFRQHHDGSKEMKPQEDQCQVIAARLRDLSWFMHAIEHRFSAWFNRTRSPRRRGTLWAGRFKSVILEGETALWECLKYIEMNAVRAGLVSDPADYRFCSWGEWNGSGTHPFADNFLRHVTLNLGERAQRFAMADLHRELRTEFARVTTAEAGGTETEIDQAIAEAARKPALLPRLDRRVRYWSDGLVIGGQLFVRQVVGAAWGRQIAERHRLARSAGADRSVPLYAYRCLRDVPV